MTISLLTCGRLRRGLVLVAALLLFIPSARAASVPCAAEVSLEPARAIVGQQVLYRVRILRREDVTRVRWVQPPAFSNLRAEWLPGRAEDARSVRDGTVYHVREDHRALFAPWPGRLVLPAFALQCTLASGEERIAEVPSVVLEAIEPPAAGRPEGFTGVIGPLQLQVLSESTAIELGDSIRVSVSVRGTANLWDMEPPLRGLEQGAEVEILRERPEVDLEAGARLYVRRHFRLTLVPRRAGQLTIPSVEVPHYDTEAGAYRVARSRPIQVAVGAPASRRAASDRRDGDATNRTVRNGSVDGRGVAIAAAVFVVSGTVYTGWLWRRRASWQQVERALAEADRARERDDSTSEAAALMRALQAAQAVVRAARTTPHREQLDELHSELTVVRFGGQGASPPRERTRRLIRELR